jgi:hypothetical protein
MLKRFTRIPTSLLNLKNIQIHENILVDYQKLIYYNQPFNKKANFHFLPNSFLLDNICDIHGSFHQIKFPKSNHLIFLEEGFHYNPSNFVYRYWMHLNFDTIHSLTLIENLSDKDEISEILNLNNNEWYPSITNFNQYKNSVSILKFHNKIYLEKN